ncbi:MAG: glycoside hydrolase family 2 [Clostridiales bacterium]|jgi:beta-galactosidase|nr:glycoside hydrolase family 2 [Clostridiales bacterium]MDF2609837.1 glycoside hydrolase family 2 [Lachnospiraceae bacterium]
MKAYSFNNDWTYKHLGENGLGHPITIPHDAMLYEKRTKDAKGGKNIGWFEGYDYIYSKTFEIPEDYINKIVIFEFEGVYRDSEVFINGEKAAARPYGYTNFYVEANSFLNYGESNKIDVVAHNAEQPNSRWYSGAGIYRPVTMWVSDKKHIMLNGVKIKTLSIHPAEIEISIATEGIGGVTAIIMEGDKEVAVVEGISNGSVTFKTPIKNAKLWSCENPHLYTCKVVFGSDETKETFGIRTLSWGNEGIKINEERVIIRGACIHHDNGLLGAATYADAEERRIRILKENGYNAVRSAHNPCSKALLDACDKQGMLMMDEFVDCWYIHKTEYDYVDHFSEWWQQDLKDMVEKDYNHPCVIMYSTGNEVSETAQERGIELTRNMTEYLHGLDDTRPVTCGINIFFNFLSSIGFGVYSDKKAMKEVVKAEKRAAKGKANKKKAVGSEFFNNLAGLLGDNVMKIGATLPPCDWKTKDAFASMDIAGYNYGIFRYKRDLKKYPDRLILGSETFCKDAAAFYKLAKKEPRLVGDFVWAGMDYLGEVGIGSWEYEDYAPERNNGLGWISAGSGRIDLTGKPLGEAAYTKTSFGLMSKPVIAVRPVNHTKDKHSPSAWKMTNAMESWSWNGFDGQPAIVEIYSDSYAVELFINNRKIGKKKIKNCRALFKTKYRSGSISVVAYDANNIEIAKNELITAEDETVLRAIPEKDMVETGGLVYIRLKYTDCNEITKPLERGDIKVKVQGGELLALGNACPFNLAGYLNDHTDTYFGEALAIIKATDKQVILTATDGKYTAATSVKVVS